MITGGSGFIGSHLVRHFVMKYPDYHILNVDKLTYAANQENLLDIENKSNYTFLKCDISNYRKISDIIAGYSVDAIINLAAESHVDRSISNPFEFVKTNVLGTVTLMQAAKDYWDMLPEKYEGKMFYHVSTDEVYGSLDLDEDRSFTEDDKYQPSSPYSASKASSDHFVRAFHRTYGFPTLISNCSNNFGPNQFPEKLIPLVVNRIMNNKLIPVYGKGDNVRDWLYVVDHVEAIDTIFHNGLVGETYNIGGCNEISNIDLIHRIILIADDLLGRDPSEDMCLVTFIQDRKGHDKRYSVSPAKLVGQLGWKPSKNFGERLRETIQWYINNKEWLDRCETRNSWYKKRNDEKN